MARTIKMLSDMNTTMMEVERVDRAGDRLVVTGILMGNFPAEIYLEPDDLLAMVAMHLRPSPLTFVLGLPYFLCRSQWRRAEGGVFSRLRALALAAGVALAGVLGVAVAGLGIVELVRLASGLIEGSGGS